MVTKQNDKSVWAFIAPAGIIYLSVIVFPVLYSFCISLFKWDGIGKRSFVGVANYIKLFTDDPVYAISFRNNMVWLFLTVVVVTCVGLAMALVLNREFKGRTFFRGTFYFPCVVAPIAVSIIWRWMYNPNIGFINQMFKALHINIQQSWISDPKASLNAVFVASVWQGVGQTMILFLAGLQTVSKDAIEAATIDGAGAVTRFFNITVPYLRDTFIIVIANLIIASMKVFDIVYGLTGGGPNNATQMLSTYMYSQTFQYNNAGMGSAVACTMVLMMLVVVVPYIMFTAKDN